MKVQWRVTLNQKLLIVNDDGPDGPGKYLSRSLALFALP